MIIYNPNNRELTVKRMSTAQVLLDEISAKYCFITGSFLTKEKYNDIDIFVVTRSKKGIKAGNKKARISKIDFNDLHSLFYHSISKMCISKNMLPTKPLKVTMSDYWQVINEAVPTLLNRKDKYHKDIRFLILYTEYFKSGEILDTLQLDEKVRSFGNYKDILRYISENIPTIMNKQRKKSYLRRFLYTQAGLYKDFREYKAQNFLYNLTHRITRGANG